MIPAALAPMTAYRQFILYKLVPSASRPGKSDKLPVAWDSLAVANAHDPAIWTDYDTAAAMAAMCGAPYGVGFVLTPSDPFWFLDIDDCLTPDGTAWNDLALRLCQHLAGAAVEVSQSGRGLHVFGTGAVPAHGCKNTALGLELYHEGRFVAFGAWNPAPTGDAGHDCTGALSALAAELFPPGTPASPVGAAGWSVGPAPEWRGPTDDTDLIRRACLSKSAAGAFGARASFADLWTGDADALGAAYPAEGRPYDASSADAALAQHLAFWTGRDCSRIQHLMEQSGLAREKYSREDYLPRTILGAVARQTDVCQDRIADGLPEPAAAAPAPSRAVGRPVSGRTILGVEDQARLFAGHAYVRDCHRIMTPEGLLMGREQFDAWHGGFQFVMDTDNAKLSASAWECFTASRAYRFPKVHHAAFRPSLAPGAVWTAGGREYINTYSPIETDRTAGDPKPFLDYMQRAFPVKRDREILLAYAAAIVQHPGVKFQWCPLIQGCPGNGKSFFSECVIEAVGRPHWFSPKASELTGKFNDWIYGRLLITVEDVYVPAHKADTIEALKPMITGGYLEIEGKGADRRTAEICANFILNSNHKDAIRKTRDDRRFAIFYSGQQSAEDLARDGMDGEYFPDLYNWARAGGYAIVNDYLRSYAIPAELNPATRCHRAPVTSSTAEACRASQGPVEQEVQHAIESERTGFRHGWISSHYFDALLREIGAERAVPRNKRREMLRQMGFVPHPALPEGRCNNIISPDGIKPRLYVAEGHPTAALTEPAAVCAAYSAAQQDAPGRVGANLSGGPGAAVLAFRPSV